MDIAIITDIAAISAKTVATIDGITITKNLNPALSGVFIYAVKQVLRIT